MGIGEGVGTGTLKAGGKATFTGNRGGANVGDGLIFWWENKNKTYNYSGFEFKTN